MSDPYATIKINKKGNKMEYNEMFQTIGQEHSIQMSSTFAERQASVKRLDKLEIEFPELFAKALADYNEMLSKW